MDYALLALSALLLNALLGGPRRWYQAAGLLAFSRLPIKILRELERKLNRNHRGKREREVRGIVLVAAVSAASLLAGFICRLLLHPHLELIELILLALALPVRPTYDLAALIRKYLQSNNLMAARRVLEGTSWRHHAVLDEHGVSRAAIEIIAVNFAEKIASPIFWFMLFGLPGLFTCKAITLMQGTLAKPGKDEPDFAHATQMLHDLIHYIPSRIAAVFWLIASLFMASGKPALSASHAAQFIQLPSQALSLLSAATVLKLSLGGPLSIYSHEAWLGAGTAKAMQGDIGRAQYLYGLLSLFLFLLLALLF